MDDNKKPGARDISDLKARLGLKKTGTMATVSPTGEPTPSPIPGAAPTPAAIPAPFGQPAQPAPVAAQPAAPPDPRRDPFAAQQTQQAANLAAFYGYGQALPGTAEGAGEPMDKPKPWGRIGAVVGGGLLVFIVGSFWGGISKTRSEFNETTDQAVVIRNEVDKYQKTLGDILAELRNQKGTSVDIGQAARLAAIPHTKPGYVVLFHTNYAHLESLAIDRLFSYYNNTIKLYDAIDAHAKKTEIDKDAIQRAVTKASGVEKNYGVIEDLSHPIPVVTFVEVGAPVCPKAGDTNCTPAELKFKYRVDAGSPFNSERPVKGKPGETILPLQRNPLFNTVASGSVDAIAAEAYGRRVRDIVELVGELDKTSKELVPELKKTAERPHVFTF